MTINISNLHSVLLQKIQNTTDKIDRLQYTKAIEQLNLGVVTSVYSFASLPTVPDIEGQLYFVESDRALYIYNVEYSQWILLATDIITASLAWGSNISGQLGDNTVEAKSSPVSIVGGFIDWSQVSAGAVHTAAVRTGGSLWTWGCNGNGRLGDGTLTNRSSPVSVVGGFTDWCQVSARCTHTAAVRTNGSLWTWGLNNIGQLGDNTILSKTSPVSVVGGFTDWCQVSAGRCHTAAVRTNCTIWTWGCNGCGRLGDNTTIDKSSPVSIVGGFLDWCQVSASNYHTAAVRTTGSLWAWGSNTNGQLGDGTTASKISPVSVVGGFTDWYQVSTAAFHTAAVRTNGSLWAWGNNSDAQLGDGTTISKTSPVSVVGGITDWCQVSAGLRQTAAVRTNGSLWAWGCNGGRLGDGTIVNTSSPVSVVGGFCDWCQISAGDDHTAALRSKTI